MLSPLGAAHDDAHEVVISDYREQEPMGSAPGRRARSIVEVMGHTPPVRPHRRELLRPAHDFLVGQTVRVAEQAEIELGETASAKPAQDMIVVLGQRVAVSEKAVPALLRIGGKLLVALVHVSVVPDLVLLLGAGALCDE